MKLKGIIFDVDGTMANTEEIHRQAFNKTFREFDLDWYWSVKDYHQLLSISGGKERFKKCLNEDEVLKKSVKEPTLFIQKLHQHKSENYRSLLNNGDIQLRPGVIRLINEARENNILLGIATSSSSANLRTLLNKTMQLEPEELFNTIVSSDIVQDKKPSPIVYQCALASLGLTPESCIVIEDTDNGNRAALNANLNTIITTHQYTVDNDFMGASLVTNHLGEPDNAFTTTMAYRCEQTYVDIELVEQIIAYGDSNISPFEELQDIASNIN